jgi:hypothetical protein
MTITSILRATVTMSMTRAATTTSPLKMMTTICTPSRVTSPKGDGNQKPLTEGKDNKEYAEGNNNNKY